MTATLLLLLIGIPVVLGVYAALLVLNGLWLGMDACWTWMFGHDPD